MTKRQYVQENDGRQLKRTRERACEMVQVSTHQTDGNLYLVLREGNAVYRMDPHDGRIYHMAGTGESGYSGDGGSAQLARLSYPKAIAWAPGASLYLADTESHTIGGTGQRGDGQDGEARQCRLARPPGIFVSPGGVIYIADSESY